MANCVSLALPTARPSLSLIFSPLGPVLSDTYWSTYVSVDLAVTQVFRTLPDITDQRELHEAERDVKLNPSLLMGRCYILTTLIILHSIDANKVYDDPGNPVSDAQRKLDEARGQLAREKTVMVARLMAKDIRRVEDTSFLYSHACLGVSAYFK